MARSEKSLAQDKIAQEILQLSNEEVFTFEGAKRGLLGGRTKYRGERKPLAAGSFGFIYRGVNEKQREPVALKRLFDSQKHDPEKRARFAREAAVLLEMSSVPSVVHAEEYVDSKDESPTLVMEFLNSEDYQSLKEYSDGQGALDFDEALEILEDVAVAVEEGHKKGIYHLDLSRSNIMVNRQRTRRGVPRAKVIDYGASNKVLGEAQSGSVGTPSILAPERDMPMASRTPEQWYQTEIYSVVILFMDLVMGKPRLFPDDVAAPVLKAFKAGLNSRDGRIFALEKFPDFRSRLEDKQISTTDFENLINRLLFYNMNEMQKLIDNPQYVTKRANSLYQVLQALKQVCRV